MHKRHHPTLRNNCSQLALVVVGFVLAISLLESKGMVVWAQRLDVSPTQQRVLHTMQQVDDFWSAVAGPVTSIRPRALDYLNQHGWSDLPPNTTPDTAPNTTVDAPVDHPTVNLGDHPNREDNTLPQPPINQGDGSITHSVSPQDTPAQGPTGEGLPLNPPSPDQPDQPPGTQGITSPPAAQAITPWLPTVTQPDAAMKLAALPQALSTTPRHVVLAGDSMMAVGLGAQLQRDLAPYRNSVVTLKAFRSATGLARPDVFNWQKEYPLMLGNQKPQVVIVAIGANDTQNLEVNRKVLTLGSPEWREVYAQRLTDYLNMLTQDGAVVLWMKLPTMRPNKYNQNITVVNEVAQAVVAQNPRAIWWDPTNRFVNAKGGFQEFAVLTPGRKPVRIRQSDGIHFSDEGAKLVTTDIINWINPEPLKPPESIETTTSAVPVPAEPLPPVEATPAPSNPEPAPVTAPVDAPSLPSSQPAESGFVP